MNLFAKPNEQNDTCIKSAMVRKGGCEETKEKVLQTMREAGKPVSAGDVTKALGADRKEVDKAFAELKKEGAIVSPVRCKWTPAQ